MKTIFFKTQFEFRNWLEKYHQNETELMVGFYKVGSDMPSMTWSESVDQAICFGWIDGVRKSINEESYCIRFTPRKKTSIWSAINIKKVEALTGAGLMTAAGLKAYGFRTEDKSNVYSHENKLAELEEKYEDQFRANKPAWDFFSHQAPSYRKIMIHWVMNAKMEQTRQARLEKIMKASEEQKRLT
jgi:uncharacterized protein YdeI (YjbR/CyaY-like superfamily)